MKEDTNHVFTIGDENGEVYKIEDTRDRRERKIQSPELLKIKSKGKGEYLRPTLFDTIGSILIYFNIAKKTNTDPYLKELFEITGWRNSFIHGSKEHFSVDELMQLIEILHTISKKMIA